MTKASDVYSLARAALARDHEAVRARIECLCANEPERSRLKQDLKRLLARQGPAPSCVPLDPKASALVRQHAPTHRLDEVALPEALAAEVQRLLFDHRHAEHLRAHHLAPRMRVLLIGPPGTGKTVLAGALAGALQLPVRVVDYGRLISSYMGATGANITLLADALMDTPCVLFIDEMDTVLSERAGQSSRPDVGEQARVVATLLLALDRIGAAGRRGHRRGHQPC